MKTLVKSRVACEGRDAPLAVRWPLLANLLLLFFLLFSLFIGTIKLGFSFVGIEEKVWADFGRQID